MGTIQYDKISKQKILFGFCAPTSQTGKLLKAFPDHISGTTVKKLPVCTVPL